MKRLILCVLMLGILLPAGARRYPFMRPDKSQIQYPAGTSPDYTLFLCKLYSLLVTGNTDVKVLHMGGSHVQGGTFTDRLRKHFLSLRYGMDGGRGLVFPFSAAGTNTPSSYNTSWQGSWESGTCLKPRDMELGVSGMAVTARDTSARVVVDLVLKEPQLLQQHYSFKTVDLLGEGSLEPILILNGKDTVRGVVGKELCHFELPHYTDWFQLAFKGKGSYTVRGFYLDRPNAGFTLSEAGVNGASTHSWLRCSHFTEDLRRLQPDLVVFSIGINDSWRRGRAANEHTAEAERAFRDLAAEYKAVFWDWYEVMGGYGSMARWQDAGLTQADKVHFTPEGYRTVADLLFDAILEDYYLRK